MILKTTIAINVTRNELKQISRVLDAHLSQYLESAISKAIEREIIREIVSKAPPPEIISRGKEV